MRHLSHRQSRITSYNVCYTKLLRANKLTANQYRALVERAGKMTDKELGLLLINAGYVSQEDILVNLQEYFAEVIRRLYTWVEGSFRFEAEMLPPDDRINVRLDLENLIIEGSRQLREWEQLQDEIPVITSYSIHYTKLYDIFLAFST